MSTKTLWINTPIRGDMINEFEMIKRHLGIASSADVVRFLVREQARRLAGQQMLPLGHVSDLKTGSDQQHSG